MVEYIDGINVQWRVKLHEELVNKARRWEAVIFLLEIGRGLRCRKFQVENKDAAKTRERLYITSGDMGFLSFLSYKSVDGSEEREKFDYDLDR